MVSVCGVECWIILLLLVCVLWFWGLMKIFMFLVISVEEDIGVVLFGCSEVCEILLMC